MLFVFSCNDEMILIIVVQDISEKYCLGEICIIILE